MLSMNAARSRPAFLTTLVFAATTGLTAAQQPTDAPLPVRHDTPRAGREFLVLRHQKLVPGSHRRFYELSRDGVWPFFEKIGARVVGQWQVVHPDGGGSEEFDEGWRLARYRSFNHWAATRRSQLLGGNGPDYRAFLQALEDRNQLRLGSDGPVFLEGTMAPGGPFYTPALGERYEPASAGTSQATAAPHPVRHATAQPGQEILTLRHFKIRKGTFEEFYRLSQDGVWPFFEKMGARVVGQWLVVYPSPGELEAWAGSNPPRPESPDYDEAYMLVRYASYDHWQATRPPVMAALGGDGPDFEACRDALRKRALLTLETSVQFLQGFLYQSPPIYLPALDEQFRRVEP